MLNLALIGAGNIGKVHAGNVAAHPRARLGFVFDSVPETAEAVAGQYGARLAGSLEETLGADVDAVIIASSTATHGEILEACVHAKKPFICEKPLASSVTAAEKIVAGVKAAGITAAIGFNRRFDFQYAGIKEAVERGDIGKPELMLITSRTAAPPTFEFIKTSGGLLGEKGSHFYDLACWITGEYPAEIQASGSALINPRFAEIGEVDTAVITLCMPSGVLCQLDFSWRAAYGQDERLEILGALGMLQTRQGPVSPYARHTEAGEMHEGRFPGWLERFEPTYKMQLDAFIHAIETGTEAFPAIEDGLAAQRLTEAGMQSIRERRAIKVARG
jgi:myo-inositol 2-dehydrogenase / D-chiro-inositol 1-dehydrogenase